MTNKHKWLIIIINICASIAVVVAAYLWTRPRKHPPEKPVPQIMTGCQGLTGIGYISVEERSVGPQGAARGNWYIRFRDDGKFSWQLGDTIEDGTYTCENGEITGMIGLGTFSGTYRASERTLNWEGVYYRIYDAPPAKDAPELF